MATNNSKQETTRQQSRRELERWLQETVEFLAQREIAEAADRYEAKLAEWKIGAAL